MVSKMIAIIWRLELIPYAVAGIKLIIRKTFYQHDFSFHLNFFFQKFIYYIMKVNNKTNQI